MYRLVILKMTEPADTTDPAFTTITLGSSTFKFPNVSFYSEETNKTILKPKVAVKTPTFQPIGRKSPSDRKSPSGRNSPTSPNIKLPSFKKVNKIPKEQLQEQPQLQEHPQQHFVWQPPQNINFITQDGMPLCWMPNNTWHFINMYGQWEYLTEHTGIVFTNPEGILILQKSSGECVYMCQY